MGYWGAYSWPWAGNGRGWRWSFEGLEALAPCQGAKQNAQREIEHEIARARPKPTSSAGSGPFRPEL